MKQLLILLSVCIFLACGQTTQQTDSEEIPAQEDRTEPIESTEEVPPPPARQAFIVGQNVNFRSEASVNGEKLGQLNSGDLVDVLEVSEPMSLDGSDDPCKEFPWVKFRSEQGEGWLYGKFIYEVQTDHARIHRKLPNYVKVNDTRFFFVLGKNFGIGASDAEGLTGCDDFFLVGLIKEEAEAVRLVEISGKKDYADSPWWRLVTDDGMSEEMSELSIVENGHKTIVGVTAYFQEGHATYDVVVSMNDHNQIVAQVEKYQTFEQ